MLLRILKALYFWTVYPIVTFVLFTYLAIWQIVAKIIGNKTPDRHTHNVAVIWAKIILKFMPGWHLVVTGKENLPTSNEATVAVSNHESMADIWVIYALNFQFRWLSKVEIFHFPIIGRCMRWAGYIPIVRGNKESHLLSMQQSAAWLKQGVSMLFFPEGTRSKTGEMLPFKIGAFKLANECNVPILPIATKGTREFVKKGGYLPGTATVKLEVLPKEYKLPHESLEQFAERVRAKILAKVNLM
jgi:1-acyl-sn-glycerol-3-phosphate acyltransferase